MDGIWLGLRLLLLLGVANSAPIAARRLLADRWAAPLDGGLNFVDGRPLLGPGKTIRGVAAAVVATALASWALGMSPQVGALLGAVSMAGDALASFVKRRLGVAPSGRATGLDQVPESLLPLLAVQGMLDLSAVQILAVTIAFFILEIPLARWAFRLGLRERPY
jgi:CDP-2,3-bis-(O-geranylgeranyl)-sn-glycerol synthase